MGIKSSLRNLVIDLDNHWDKARLKLLRAVGGAGNLQILSYGGLGWPEKLMLKGRVLVARGSTEYESDDDFWDDLANMYRRLNTTEIPGARVKISAAGAEVETVTDDEGYFDVELDAQDQPFSPPFQAVELELLDTEGDEAVVTKTRVPVRSAAASFLVISDIDDTVVHTQATNLLAMARATFLGNASSRTPFAGVSALYNALVDGPGGDDGNPLVFISRSPWNLFDLFDQFCDLQGIPSARTIYLRDWGFSREGLTSARSKGHKFGLIRRVLEFEPDLPVILIGDSGQKDPEIYHAISDEHPGRILGAFIRDVSLTQSRTESIRILGKAMETDGAVLYLAKDSLNVAEKAAGHDWIKQDAVAAVAASMESGKQPPGSLEKLIDAAPASKTEEEQ